MQAARVPGWWCCPYGIANPGRSPPAVPVRYPGPAADWQTKVDALLPVTSNNIEFFGETIRVDATGEFVRRKTAC